MEIQIGNRIRELRKARGITQEQLAESIGVSFQAVSKWETGLALPDITLVPRLAQFFGVTTDRLFSYSLEEMEREIEACTAHAFEFRESDPTKSRAILEAGLEKYPGNEILLNHMLYVMNYSEEPDATIRLANRLIDQTSAGDIKYDALRFLAYAYNAKGDTDAAVAALEQIPELYFTKLSEMAFVLTGKPKFDAAKKQKWISFETLIQMMWKLAECYEAQGCKEKAIAETEKALALIKLLAADQDGAYDYSSYTAFFKGQLERMKGEENYA